jgi:hypothetical protein
MTSEQPTILQQSIHVCRSHRFFATRTFRLRPALYFIMAQFVAELNEYGLEQINLILSWKMMLITPLNVLVRR